MNGSCRFNGTVGTDAKMCLFHLSLHGDLKDMTKELLYCTLHDVIYNLLHLYNV